MLESVGEGCSCEPAVAEKRRATVSIPDIANSVANGRRDRAGLFILIVSPRHLSLQVQSHRDTAASLDQGPRSWIDTENVLVCKAGDLSLKLKIDG